MGQGALQYSLRPPVLFFQYMPERKQPPERLESKSAQDSAEKDIR